MRQQRLPPQDIHDRNPIGKAVQDVATFERIVIETRMDLVPVAREPRVDENEERQCVGECADVKLSRDEMRQRAKIAALLQR
jgi:hypothetical protein